MTNEKTIILLKDNGKWALTLPEHVMQALVQIVRAEFRSDDDNERDARQGAEELLEAIDAVW